MLAREPALRHYEPPTQGRRVTLVGSGGPPTTVVFGAGRGSLHARAKLRGKNDASIFAHHGHQ